MAWSVLAFIILGTLALIAMNDHSMLHKRIPFEKSLHMLVERAREFLKTAGYPTEFADSDYGFKPNADLLNYIEESDKTTGRWKNLDSHAILFWYRQSPRSLESHLALNLKYNPPLQYPGEVLVEMDTEGRLISLQSVPPSDVGPSGETKAEPDWPLYFKEAGFDLAEWTETDPQRNPAFFADTQTAWKGSLSNRPGTAARIEAATYRGKAVSFQIVAPWTKHAQAAPEPMTMAERIAAVFAILVLSGIVVGLLYFAMKNLRLGRGDRRNATRLALFAIGLQMIGKRAGEITIVFGAAIPKMH